MPELGRTVAQICGGGPLALDIGIPIANANARHLYQNATAFVSTRAAPYARTPRHMRKNVTAFAQPRLRISAAQPLDIQVNIGIPILT